MPDEYSLTGSSQPASPVFVPSSVFAIPDLDALNAISNSEAAGYIYARDNHPNAVQLEAELARWESAAGAVVCGNGMASIASTLLSDLSQGSRIVASDQLYGRTNQLLGQELSRFGIITDYCDTNELSAVETALQRSGQPAQYLIIETISNPLLRVADIPALVQLCRKTKTKLLVDNTFATPYLCKPLEYGADIVIESLTKFMGGHSDITLGFIAVQDSALLQRLKQVRSIWGFMGDSFPCWMTLRSLPTFQLRFQRAIENASRLAMDLPSLPGVERVHYSGLSGHPDHQLSRKLLGNHPGSMLCIELKGGRASVNRFFQRTPSLKFCPSLGDVQTTCSYPAETSHRYMDPELKIKMGITEGLIRLSIGIEPYEELWHRFKTAHLE